MKIVLKDDTKRDQFVAIMSMLKSCSNTVHFYFEDTHFFIQGMDQSHVCLFDLRLESTWFDEYEFTALAEPVFVCTNILSKILSTIVGKKKQPLTLIVDDGTNLNIDFVDASFTIPLMTDDAAPLLSIPSVEYDAEFAMPVKKLLEMTALMLVFGDTMNIECSDTGVVLSSAPEGESGKMCVTVPMDDLNEYSVGDTVSATYSLGLLHRMGLTSKLTDAVTVGVSCQYPLKIGYSLSDSDAGDNHLWFFVAPRMSDTDE